ncbi:MAG: hypothetical protein ACK54M_02360, partial [Pseudanabaena sp.]
AGDPCFGLFSMAEDRQAYPDVMCMIDLISNPITIKGIMQLTSFCAYLKNRNIFKSVAWRHF